MDPLPGLARALAQAGLVHQGLAPLPAAGLAHDHVRLLGTPFLARLPLQSQLGLSAAANLTYQAESFRRAAASGVTPALLTVLPVGADLPWGALIVRFIPGGPARLPGDLAAIARALGALHALPLPPPSARAPLLDPADPLAATLGEVRARAPHLATARLAAPVAARIAAELAAAERDAASLPPPPRTLVAFDAHPGNFVRDPEAPEDGRVALVDLDKLRYGCPALDLAHATLLTSTTWDLATSHALSPEERAAFHAAWATRVEPALAAETAPFLVPCRRLMWLWAVTWCALWRATHGQAARDPAEGGEDWSADKRPDPLIAHVRARVGYCLSPEGVAAACDWVDDPLAPLGARA